MKTKTIIKEVRTTTRPTIKKDKPKDSSFVKGLLSDSASAAISGLSSVKDTTKDGFKWLRNKK